MLNILKNKAISFILLKYLAYTIQLINAVWIAQKLGLHYFGLYSFALLVIQYLSYTNFGVQYAYSVLFSDVASKTENQRRQITETSVTLLIMCCAGLVVAFLISRNWNIFPKYVFHSYSYWLLSIGILQHVNIMFVNIFRVHGRIQEINVYYLLLPLSQLLMLFFFNQEKLFYALLISTFVGNLLSVFLFIYGWPNDLKGLRWFSLQGIGTLIQRGFFLLMYNLTFYGLIIATKSFVSAYFSVDEFALFNFSNTISNAVFLLLGSLNFLFYPKLINLISAKSDRVELGRFIEKIRKYYLTLTFLVVLVSLLLIPVIFVIVPKYSGAIRCMQILLLAQSLINNSFGYSTLLVQRKKEVQMTLFALLAILIILSLCYVGMHFSPSLEMVSWSVVIGVVVYNFLVSYAGIKLVQYNISIKSLLTTIFDPYLFSPLLVYFLMEYLGIDHLISIAVASSLYFMLNYKLLNEIAQYVLRSVQKSDDMLIID